METLRDYVHNDNGSKEYYWAYAIYQGKLIIDGYYRTYNDAYNFAYQKIPVRFEVVCLGTKDRRKAVNIIKHQVLESTSDLDFALRRAKHIKRQQWDEI